MFPLTIFSIRNLHSFKGDRNTPGEKGWVFSLFPVSGNSVIHRLLVSFHFHGLTAVAAKAMMMTQCVEIIMSLEMGKLLAIKITAQKHRSPKFFSQIKYDVWALLAVCMNTLN